MNLKDVMKETIKLGGCFGILVVSSGFLALTAYRLGYIDACEQQSKSREKQSVL